MERAYTVAEIDAMRRYYLAQTETAMIDPTFGVDLWGDDIDVRPYPIEVPISRQEAEVRVRTAMLGGVDPASIMSFGKRETEEYERAEYERLKAKFGP